MYRSTLGLQQFLYFLPDAQKHLALTGKVECRGLKEKPGFGLYASILYFVDLGSI
jgi:hypothetical protein